jgi:hypothetical protein
MSLLCFLSRNRNLCFGLLSSRFFFLLMLYKDFLLPSYSLLNFKNFPERFSPKTIQFTSCFIKNSRFFPQFCTKTVTFTHGFVFKLTVSPPGICSSPPESLLPPGAKSLLDLVFLQAHLPATKLYFVPLHSLGKAVCYHQFSWTVNKMNFILFSKFPHIMVLYTYML